MSLFDLCYQKVAEMQWCELDFALSRALNTIEEALNRNFIKCNSKADFSVKLIITQKVYFSYL
jgi:hypothetical protein